MWGVQHVPPGQAIIRATATAGQHSLAEGRHLVREPVGHTVVALWLAVEVVVDEVATVEIAGPDLERSSRADDGDALARLASRCRPRRPREGCREASAGG